MTRARPRQSLCSSSVTDKRDSVSQEPDPGPDHTKKFHDHELVIDPTEPDPSEPDVAKGVEPNGFASSIIVV